MHVENMFSNKKVSVFGLGVSGKAAADKLFSLGASIFVSEKKPASAFPSETLNDKFQYEFGGHTNTAIVSADLIIVSPGIHLDLLPLIEAKKRGIPIISEIELAYQILQKPIVAVTGTNGKTTTTTLIGEMLKAAGKKVAVAGNIGDPLIAVDDSALDFIVVEISSYQLESIVRFRPKISVLLNIQEDHLARHRSMQEYMKQKSRIFMNQQGDDYLVCNADDQQVLLLAKEAQAKIITFSPSHIEILGLSPREIRIPGKHNLENALAAAHAANLCGVPKETIAAVLKSFPGVEHRLEFVAEKKGIKFYNDSKATNPNSTLVALETFKGQTLILILGGRDKGVSLELMCQKIKEGVFAVILLGEASARFQEELNRCGFSNIYLTQSMEEAVKLALKLGSRGENVLLSPACASFDMYANYEERGRVFKEKVAQL